jgi:hypothetical protein
MQRSQNRKARGSAPEESVDIEKLAAQQGVGPVADPGDLVGDFWPEDENIDDFIAAVRRWRKEEKKL